MLCGDEDADSMEKVMKTHLIHHGGLHAAHFRNQSGRKNTTMNMTEGKPLVLLSVFALPLLIGNLFQQAYNLADSMIV